MFNDPVLSSLLVTFRQDLNEVTKLIESKLAFVDCCRHSLIRRIAVNCFLIQVPFSIGCILTCV